MKKDIITMILLVCVLVLCVGIVVVLTTDMGEETEENGDHETHSHNEFVEKTGDTMTGDLVVQSLYANGVINGDGSGIYNLSASEITTGSIDSARLPSNIDADNLDGLDSTDFAMATHDHNSAYYTKTESDGKYSLSSHTHPSTGDADTLDGYDSIYFAEAAHTHPAGDADTLDGYDSTDFVMAAHTHDNRYYNKTESDTRYTQFGHTHPPGDADTLDGFESTAFAMAAHIHNTLYYNKTESDTRYAQFVHAHPPGDATTLDGYDSTDFAMDAHIHDTRYYLRAEVDANFLNLSGGTLSGDLYLPSLYASGVISGHGGDLTDLNASKIANGTIDNTRLPTNINADTLDGLDSTGFALAAHSHDTRYYQRSEVDMYFLNLSGGTMTGDLYLPNLYASGVIDGDGSGITNLNANNIMTGTINPGRLPPNINAGTLDGLDSSDFAMSAHTHDARYYMRSEVDMYFLNLSGGTLTGDLYLPNLYASGVINGDGSGLTNLDANDIMTGTINPGRLPPNINADTLDGLDSLNFAMSAHTHDASDITGGNLVVDGLNVDTGTLYVDSANDRVGINITNPSQELVINKDQNDWTNLQLNNPNGGTNAGSGIYFNEGGAQRAYIDVANSGNTVSSSGPNSLRIQANSGPITIHSNSANDVIIQENIGPGFVGIGTTAPTDKLHVNGDARVQGNLQVQGSTVITGSLDVLGKATFTGGVDPPYVSFSDESHESIREYANDVVEHEKVMLFWNEEAFRIEVYVIAEDNFYTITGELIIE